MAEITSNQGQEQFSSGSRKVDSILKTLFAKVCSLEQWLREIDNSAVLTSSLLKDQDKTAYVHLLKTTLVGFKENVKKIPQPICFTQVSHQQEIIIRVIRKLIQKEGPGKNVLTFGFSPMSDIPTASIFNTPDLELRHFNSSVNRLLFEAWETFLSRVGDDIMSYLLEYSSMFASVCNPAVYVQLTGEPLYQMWPYSWGSSFPVKIQNSAKLGKGVKRRKRYSESCNVRSLLLHRKNQRNKLPLTKTRKISETTFSEKGTKQKARKRKHQNTGLSAPKKRRKDHDSHVETHLAKVEELQAVCKTACSWRQGNKDDRDAEQEGLGIVLPERCKHSTPSNKFHLYTTLGKKRRKRKQQAMPHRECSSDVQSYLFHKYIPKLNLMYGMDMREKFSKYFTVNSIEVSEEGATLLLQEIFVKTDVGATLDNKCQCKTFIPITQSAHKLKVQDAFFSENLDLSRMQTSDSGTDNSSLLSSSDVVPPSPFLSGVKYYRSSVSLHGSSIHHSEDMNSSKTGFDHGDKTGQQNAFDFSELNSQTPSTSESQHFLSAVSQKDSFISDISEARSASNSNAQVSSSVIAVDFSKDKLHGVLNALPRRESQQNTNLTRIAGVLSKEENCECSSQSGQEIDARVPRMTEDFSHSQHVQSNFLGLGEPVRQFMKHFLQNHRKCPYWSLLNHYCPVKSKEVRKKQTPKPTDQSLRKRASQSHHSYKKLNTGRLLEDFCVHFKVFGFLRAVLKRVVHVQLFGGCKNMALFLKSVMKLVRLGKHEKLCLGEVMRGIKVKHCVWLLSVRCHRDKAHHMAQFLWWLLTFFVMHLIRTFFYCTDTAVYRNRTMYYRKTVWLKLQTRAIQDFRKSTNLHRITQSKKNELLASSQALGVSVLRFLPKTRSLRPIVNMSKKPVPALPSQSTSVKSTNQHLARLLQVLACEKSHDSSICGRSVSGMDDLCVALKCFLTKREADGDSRHLYFVKTDIKRCFDSIQQPLLHSIVHSILSKAGPQLYFVQKYSTVMISGGQIKRMFYTDTTRLADYECDSYIFAQCKAASNNLSDVIFIDQMITQFENFETLLKLLSSHLYNNIIKIGKQYYIQQGGISQGSVVSTMLANLYLAHLEAVHLFPAADDELSVRMVDDCLFITPNKARAERFLSVMIEGFPDYNCFVNLDKIVTNFPFDHPAVGSVQCIHEGESFPWCGLLFDSSLQVAVDYSRYSGLGISDTISFDGCHKPGETIKKKMIMSLTFRSHQIFFDPMINSKERILLNAFCTFFFLAEIFNGLIMKLPPKKRTESNPDFFFVLVQMVPEFLMAQIQRKLRKDEMTNVFPVQLFVLQWLNVCAFSMQLKRYSGYTHLKKKLNKHKKVLQKKLSKDHLESLEEICHAGASLMSTVTMF
uniref:Telomerase reverse transcriptase n=1 Tax=Pomacea diffusa TaxID=453592 RepID=A0A7G6KMQ7_9CAEN|nr:telomerase reverse transriptase (TERT) [Pomacea diffusa]